MGTAVISVRILGPLEVVIDGRPVDVPGTRTRAILTRLALDAGKAVSVDLLLEDVWGAAMPANALNALQVRISQLRHCIGRDTVRATRPGYVLAIDPAGIDAFAVETAIAKARDVIETNPQEASVRFAEALSQWRGQPFSGLDAPFAHAAEVRWGELRLGATEDKLRLELQAGRALVSLPELQELASAHPLREPLHDLLIRAFASLGRQADALDAYRRIRNRLVEELGIDPGQALQDLESSILQQDPSLLKPIGKLLPRPPKHPAKELAQQPAHNPSPDPRHETERGDPGTTDTQDSLRLRP
jgi:DNA-binding SARP family transcriptional activator